MAILTTSLSWSVILSGVFCQSCSAIYINFAISLYLASIVSQVVQSGEIVRKLLAISL